MWEFDDLPKERTGGGGAIQNYSRQFVAKRSDSKIVEAVYGLLDSFGRESILFKPGPTLVPRVANPSRNGRETSGIQLNLPPPARRCPGDDNLPESTELGVMLF